MTLGSFGSASMASRLGTYASNAISSGNATPPPPPPPAGTARAASTTSASSLSAPQADANAILQAVLAQYGLGSLSQWALNEAAAGASVDQIMFDMRSTPEFQARFPGIAIRQKAGLPAISPADYVNYENTLAQMEHQAGMPKGILTDPTRVGNLIGGDVSISELQARVQQGFQAVAYAPPEVRDYFASSYGVSGDGSLASYFLDDKRTATLLTQQATAAQIGGHAAIGGITMQQQDAMHLAQMGRSAADVGSGLAHLQQIAPLFNASVTEQNDLTQGNQGVQAEFGLNQQATQAEIAREQARIAAFRGGGTPYTDQFGAKGAGAAKPT